MTRPLFLAIFLALSLGGIPTVIAAQGPKAVLTPAGKDFGSVRQGEVVEEEFELRNAGNETLVVSGMKISERGMKLRVKAEIPPGETAKVKVEWNTEQHSHRVEGHALLLVNDPANPRVSLTLTGYIVPD